LRLIKYLFQYFYHYKWSFIIGLFFVVLSNVFGTFTPVFIRNLINEISASIQNPNSLNSNVYVIISKFIVYYLGFTLLSALFTFLMRQTIVVASRKIEFELKNDLSFFNGTDFLIHIPSKHLVECIIITSMDEISMVDQVRSKIEALVTK
jgi:ABC-type multidrug transport system fused ATPase/permease subunit